MAYHPVDKERYDVAAFDRGESYIGTEWADKVEDFGRNIVSGLQAASQDQEGIGDDILRFGGKLLQGAGAVAEAPVIKQGLQLLDAPVHYLAEGAGNIAEKAGVDPRLAKWGVRAAELGLTMGGGIAKKTGKLDDLARIASQRVDDISGNLLRNLPAQPVYAYGGALAEQSAKRSGDLQVIKGGAKATPVVDIQRSVFRNIKGKKGSEKWTQGAYDWFQKNIDKSAPMKGYPNFIDESGNVYRATPSKRGKLTAIDEAKKKASRKSRFVTQDVWKSQLKEVLDEFGMSDKYDDMARIITKGNKQQADRVTRFNKALKDKGVFDLREHFTVEHIGALKNKWPDVPENRWGIIKRKLNSKAGAKMDPPDLNIRLSGVPKDVKEWVLKQELGDLDFTRDLPVKIRRQILAATKKVDGKKVADPEKIDDILDTYFKSIGE